MNIASRSIHIRPATESDASAILNCLALAFEPYREQYSAAGFLDTVLTPETLHSRLQSMHILVALSGQKVIGTVSATRHEREGHLRGMAVLPEWRGADVAAALLTAVEEWLRSQGCKRVTLDTTLPLQAAMKFYEKNGYRRSGSVTDFFGMPLLEYVKEL